MAGLVGYQAQKGGVEVTGEQLRPLEGRPYLKSWQKRMAEQTRHKPAKVGKVKRKKKAKR